ncbi:MAG: WhiB family transcriptional regulator [Acidimicrobiia bacterium]|nr:WhiB family transcriptional regulator [Acidimicrobiia bacterium]
MAAVGPSGELALADELRDLVADLLNRPAWHADAACKEHPEVTFFPLSPAGARAAKAICASCSVQDECRASGRDEHDGIWGGVRRDDPPSRKRTRRPSTLDDIARAHQVALAKKRATSPDQPAA